MAKRQALVVRQVGGTKILDALTWGVPLETAGKRPGTTVKKHITNVKRETALRCTDTSGEVMLTCSHYPRRGSDL